MNTKGIKFLAVLAVMMMAFAAIIVLAPADRNADAVTFEPDQVDPKVITATSGTKFFISDDMTVKVKGLSGNTTIYVQNGKELVLDIRANLNPNKLTVMTVTSDLQAHTTSTVDDVWNDDIKGKTYIKSTLVSFEGQQGQTVAYKAMMPKSVTTTYTPDDDVDITVVVKTTKQFATISSDSALVNATIGNGPNEIGVTVAAGQYIVTDNATNVNYGVMFHDDSAATYTYFATGMNAGVISADKKDSVSIVDGSATVKTEKGASVKAASVSSSSITVDVDANGETTFGGVVSGGIVTIDGAMTVNGVEVKSGATVKAGSNADFTSGSTITVNGNFITKADKTELGDITITGTTGVVKLESKKAWTYDGRDPKIVLSGGFSGLIDVSSITESADVVESTFSTATVAPDQTFVFTKNTTVTSSVTVNGILIINEGVTVTITETKRTEGAVGASIILNGQCAQLINNGRIIVNTTKGLDESDVVGLHVQGGYVENNGEVKVQSNPEVNGATTFSVKFADGVKGLGFVNYGDVTVSGSDTVFLSDRFSNYGGLTVSGKFADSSVSFKNYGEFTLSSAKIDKNITVNMNAGAQTYIRHAVFEGGNTITVKHGDDASIIVGGVANAQVRGIMINDTSSMILGSKLDLSGSVGVTGLASTDVTLTMAGTIDMTEDLSISKGYTIVIPSSKATFNVYSDVLLSEGVVCTTESNLSMYVYGSVTSINDDILGDCAFSGARYSLITGTTIYEPIDDAVSEATALDIDLVQVGALGATVKSDMAIPSGMSIIGLTGSTLKIGDKDNTATLTIADGGVVSFANHVKVINGAILTANMYDLSKDKVDADVKNVDTDSNSAIYMSLKFALAYPLLAGNYIELSQPFVMTSDTLVIPEGVVVNATANDNTAVVLIDSNLVVNGVLMLDKFYFVATTDDTKSITVGDRIMEDDESGKYLKDKWYTPIGVSYLWTTVDDDGDENTWFVITNLARLQEAIDVADEAKVTVEGDVELGDLTITGRDDMPAEVTFNGDLDAETITIDDVTLIFEKDNEVTATVANALGSITITGAYVKSTTMSIYSLNDGVVTMTGTIGDTDDATYSIVFNGLTGMEDATIGWGEDSEDFPTILFNGTTVASGKKDQMMNLRDNERYSFNAGIVTVVGSLIADNGTRVTIDADVEVLGGLYAMERTETAVDGSMEINGDIFVGALKSELYDVEAAIAATTDDSAYKAYGKADHGYGKTVLSAAAVLSGKIILGTIEDFDIVIPDPEDPTQDIEITIPGKDAFITAVSGSEIDDQIIEDLDSMDIIIEDSLWLTIYGAPTAKYSMDGLKAPIINAKVDTILDADGNAVAKFSHIYKVIYGCKDATLSSYGTVYISLDYKAFTVTIKTDGSVKAVYIDGILMYTGENRNTFTLDKVEAGTHKVTVEPAAGYAADGCKLYTDMGTILPGMAFTFTEYDCIVEEGVNTYNVIYNINGTQIEPEPVPPTPEEESQWTITTILLVILVVLIAIMAVIVALRLNRS